MPESRLHAVADESLWSRLSDALGTQMGSHYPKERWSDLERGITAATTAFGMTSTEACIDWLLSAPLSRHQIEVLASCLTVGETYFFRDRRSFEVLRDEILPNLLQARATTDRRLRIWSAGCCTGEEPYSIAILLATMLPDIRDWNISILATDIDPNFLRKAAQGVYSEWSFRDTPPGIKQSYFKRTSGGRYEIAPRIKDLVTFSYLNLAEDSYPSVANGTNAMDIVFCRNVLMYFRAAHANRVLQRLGWSLLEGGWLFINPVEIPHAAVPRLDQVQFRDAIVHRKSSVSSVAGRSLGATFAEPSSFRSSQEVPAWTPAEAMPALLSRASEPPQHVSIAPAANQAAVEAPALTLLKQASVAYDEGRYAEAVQTILDILASTPDDTAAIALLARTYANQGRLAEAQQCCERAIATDKLDARWRHLLATILQELGRPEEAEDALRRALYLDQGHALAHFHLGNLLRRQGRTADATRHFRNVLDLLKHYPPEEIVPESDGIAAGRLAEMIRLTVPIGD